MFNLLSWGRNLLVPHPANNYRAKILHPSTLSAIVAVFLVYQFALNFFILFEPTILGFASNITPGRVIELTNQERLKRGLGPLSLSSTLSQAAQLKAGDMFAFNYWAHNSPSGRTPWSFFREVGYSYLYAGENLARDFMNSEAVVGAWLNSPSHRDNLLSSKYREIGLAVVNGTLNGVETTLVVQMFGTPTPAPTATSGRRGSTLRSPIFGEAMATVSAGTVVPKTAMTEATGKETTQAPLFSPFSLTKTVTIFVLGVLFGALVLDIILVWRKKVVRLSGRNLAHLAFIGVLFFLAFLTQQGAIL